MNLKSSSRSTPQDTPSTQKGGPPSRNSAWAYSPKVSPACLQNCCCASKNLGDGQESDYPKATSGHDDDEDDVDDYHHHQH
eukprot:8061974-Karenia_brevis.AAC.1